VEEEHRCDESKRCDESTRCDESMEAGADRDTGWLGSSLRVKAIISGTEDLLIDGRPRTDPA